MIQEYWDKHFKEGTFLKNVATLMTGSAIARIVPIAAAPILTRIYTPEDYGVLTLYTSVVALFALLITGCYEQAIVLPKEEKDARSIIKLSLIIAICLSFVTLIIVIVFNEQISVLLGNKDISPWLYLVPISVFSAGLYNAFNYWSNRNKKYRRLSVTRISQSVFTSGTQLMTGFSGFGMSGLIFGNITGQMVATGYLTYQSFKKDSITLKDINKEDILRNASKYQNFPKFVAIHSFLDGFRLSIIVFLISRYFGSRILGCYSFAMRMLQLPLMLMATSLSQVFYQKVASNYNSKQPISPLITKLILRLALISLPFFIIIMLFAPDIFSFVFSPKWGLAGEYARIMSPWLFISFLGSPISTIPLVLNKQKQWFYIGAVYDLLLPSVVILAAIISKSIEVTLVYMTVVGSLYLIFQIMWLIYISKNAYTNVKEQI